MSFAFAHQSKTNKAVDKKKSTHPVYNSSVPDHRTKNLNGDSPDSILHLQRAIGNQAVQKLVHANVIQTKLRISQAGDVYEQEADQVAEQVMRFINVKENVPSLSIINGGMVNRKCQSCQEEEETEMNISRKSNDGIGLEISENVTNSLHTVGLPLESTTRNFMESRFGHDFGGVRIHTGKSVARAADSINAKAYTLGKKIFFGEGQYEPHGRNGSWLLAHELAHVVQQSSVNSLDPLTASPTLISRQPATSVSRPVTKPTEKTAHKEPVDRVDGILADRVRLFEVLVWGDRYVAVLDRIKNPWSERYTPRALTAAAFASVVQYMVKTSPPISQIITIFEEMQRDPTKSITFPTKFGPSAVDRRYFVRIERDLVSTTIARLGIELSEEGRQLETEARFGAFLVQLLVEVAQNFGSVRQHLDTNATLRKAKLTSKNVFTMLTEPTLRQAAAEFAKSHKVLLSLNDVRKRDWTALARDWTFLKPVQWAGVLADITVAFVAAAGRGAIERRELRRRHELNELLRPHQLQVSAADSYRFILETYDSASSVTVDFVGPVAIEGGQTITNARGQQLFILRAGSQIIYQNLSDLRFYEQSAQGVQQELVYGVYALVAEKTKYIIPMTQLLFDITAAIFPPARIPIIAVKVLSVAHNYLAKEDELLALAENFLISLRAFNELLPGFLRKAIWATAKGGLGELFYTTPTATPKDILLLALRIGSAALRGIARAKYKMIEDVVKVVWIHVRHELKTIGSKFLLAKISSEIVVGKPIDPNASVERLTREFLRFVEKEAGYYAQLVMNMSPEDIERLPWEIEHLVTNGDAIVNLISDILAWV